jgi:hypothetical protein
MYEWPLVAISRLASRIAECLRYGVNGTYADISKLSRLTQNG